MLLSVIIPVYNVAPYLRRGLDSITAQGGNDFEVILVDDGSTDGSPAICDEYAEKYSFVRVFHIHNGGVGHARNVGIEKAEGKYLQFLDSDDFLDDGLYVRFREVLELHHDIDACFFGLKDFSDGESNEGHFVQEGLYSDEIKESEKSLANLYLAVKQAFLFFSPTTKFFRTSIVKDNKIRYREGIHFYEDYLFNLQFFYYAKKVYAIGGKAYYNYVHHPGEHLGTKYSPASVIVEVAQEIYERSERLPLTENLHRCNVLEYYNNLLSAVDSTCNKKAVVDSEKDTLRYIRLWLSEIRRLGYRDEFKAYLGNRRPLLWCANAYVVLLMQGIRKLCLKIKNK